MKELVLALIEALLEFIGRIFAMSVMSWGIITCLQVLDKFHTNPLWGNSLTVALLIWWVKNLWDFVSEKRWF